MLKIYRDGEQSRHVNFIDYSLEAILVFCQSLENVGFVTPHPLY